MAVACTSCGRANREAAIFCDGCGARLGVPVPHFVHAPQQESGAGELFVGRERELMFTPEQERAAREMLRVCRPGGRIGLANWTPESFIGQLFRTIGRYVPPAAGLKSPALWGTEVRLAELFGPGAVSIESRPRHFVFRYRSPQHWLEVFRTYYGPLNKTFAMLDEERQAALAGELIALMQRSNRSWDATLMLPSEYAEVVITTR